MDLGFFRRARASDSGRSAAEIDFDTLVAALTAYQAGTATSRALASAPVRRDWAQLSHAALVELLVGGPEWKSAVEELGGSFNTRFIREKGNSA
jgi:hypothetical protein